MIEYGYSETMEDIQGILSLQKENLITNITEEERKSEGFLTIKHTPELLWSMNKPYKHVVARVDGKIAGYALVMLREFQNTIPILVPMFDQINALSYKGQLLEKVNYCVLGQICVDKNHRGKGIFEGMYYKFREQLSKEFTYVITEVSKRNTRSTKAHTNVGFQNIQEYQSHIDQERWIIFLWDWK